MAPPARRETAQCLLHNVEAYCSRMHKDESNEETKGQGSLYIDCIYTCFFFYFLSGIFIELSFRGRFTNACFW